jgi:predicted amidohydrolase YtcJ
MAALMNKDFQIVVHAIGDRANRETLDLFESVERSTNSAVGHDVRETRPRIEHAQVVSPQDIPRFAKLGVIASMQPSHAVEDMAWAEARLGPDRIKGAYAWRTLRRAGARLVFSSDLPGTDYNIFYGLHSAVTRQDKQGQPAGGWRPQERMTIEEAMRGWTNWATYAGFQENRLGVIASGRPADLTVMDIDPMQIGERDPAKLLTGKILMTIVNGKTVWRANTRLP